MKKLIVLLGLVVIVTSCTSVGERMSNIRPGMTKPEVIRILGKPTSVGGVSGVEVLHYTYYPDLLGWSRHSYYFARIVDGKVESYGPESHNNRVTDSNPPLKK